MAFCFGRSYFFGEEGVRGSDDNDMMRGKGRLRFFCNQ